MPRFTDNLTRLLQTYKTHYVFELRRPEATCELGWSKGNLEERIALGITEYVLSWIGTGRGY